MTNLRCCTIFTIAATTFLLVGCGDSIGVPTDPVTGVPLLYPEGAPAAGPVQAKSAALVQVQNCSEVNEQLRKHAIARMVTQVQASFARAWREREDCGHHPGAGYGTAADAGMAPSPQQPAHSETNNQVLDVDEPDVIKTDGNYIYMIGGGALRILQSWPAAATQELAKVTVEGTPKKLFVEGTRLLVYSAVDRVGGGSTSEERGYGQDDQVECTYGYDCVPLGDGLRTKLTVFDITDRRAPKLVREVTLSSSLLAARRIDHAVHTVVTLAPRQKDLPTSPSHLDICSSTRDEIYRAFRTLLLENLARVQIDITLPTMEDVIHRGSQTSRNASPLVDCQGFLGSSLADGTHLTSVVSLGLLDEKPARATTIFSQPGVVYASKAALYIAEPRTRDARVGWYEMLADAQEATTVHKLVLGASPPSSRYVASGIVQGRLLNQFALDEHEGYLRLASTTGHVGSGDETSMHNTLTVLKQQGAALVQTGLLDQLAPTEDIRAVRFDGPRGYVVTFKKTDPLFVLDLAVPAKPRVLGELKIPGFSTYMHKMDERHLLTIGYDADDQGSFAWFKGIQLQIFDVSNPTAPQLKFKYLIGTRGSSSEALTDHLAFTYYAPKHLLALPMTICEGGGDGGMYGAQLTFSGLMLFDVTATGGFTLRGKVPFPSENASCSNWWSSGSSVVQRSLIIENFVYAMSDARLKVSDLDHLEQCVADLPLQ